MKTEAEVLWEIGAQGPEPLPRLTWGRAFAVLRDQPFHGHKIIRTAWEFARRRLASAPTQAGRRAFLGTAAAFGAGAAWAASPGGRLRFARGTTSGKAGPGAGWTGVAGSGNTAAGIVTQNLDASFGVAAPTLHYLGIGGQDVNSTHNATQAVAGRAITGAEILCVEADMNSDYGTLSVSVLIEGKYTPLPAPRYFSYTDVNGVLRVMYGWGVQFDWAAAMAQAAAQGATATAWLEVWFVATPPALSGLAVTAIGPILLAPRNAINVFTVAPGAQNPGDEFDIVLHLDYTASIDAGKTYPTYSGACGYINGLRVAGGANTLKLICIVSTNAPAAGQPFQAGAGGTTVASRILTKFVSAPGVTTYFGDGSAAQPNGGINFDGVWLQGANMVLDLCKWSPKLQAIGFKQNLSTNTLVCDGITGPFHGSNVNALFPTASGSGAQALYNGLQPAAFWVGSGTVGAKLNLYFKDCVAGPLAAYGLSFARLRMNCSLTQVSGTAIEGFQGIVHGGSTSYVGGVINGFRLYADAMQVQKTSGASTSPVFAISGNQGGPRTFGIYDSTAVTSALPATAISSEITIPANNGTQVYVTNPSGVVSIYARAGIPGITVNTSNGTKCPINQSTPIEIGCTVIGKIAGTVLTVDTVIPGTLSMTIGMVLSGPGVTAGTIIASNGGIVGGKQTWNLSVGSTVSTDTTMKGTFTDIAIITTSGSVAATVTGSVADMTITANATLATQTSDVVSFLNGLGTYTASVVPPVHPTDPVLAASFLTINLGGAAGPTPPTAISTSNPTIIQTWSDIHADCMSWDTATYQNIVIEFHNFTQIVGSNTLQVIVGSFARNFKFANISLCDISVVYGFGISGGFIQANCTHFYFKFVSTMGGSLNVGNSFVDGGFNGMRNCAMHSFSVGSVNFPGITYTVFGNGNSGVPPGAGTGCTFNNQPDSTAFTTVPDVGAPLAAPNFTPLSPTFLLARSNGTYAGRYNNLGVDQL